MEEEKRLKYIYASKIDSIEFRPKYKEGRDSFYVWDNERRRVIRRGTIQTSEGRMDVKPTMRIPEQDKGRFRKVFQAVRSIETGGEDAMLVISNGTERELVAKIVEIEASGKDPLRKIYRIEKQKIGNKPWQVKYVVSVVGDAESNDSAPDVSIPEEKPDASGLSEKENSYIKALREKPDLSFDQKLFVLTNNAKIPQERAKELIQKYLF